MVALNRIYSLGELAELTGATLIGDPTLPIERLEPLASATAGAVTFCTGAQHGRLLAQTGASAVLIHPHQVEANRHASLMVDNPYLAYAHLSQRVAPERAAATIHPTAIIAETAEIGAEVAIGAYTVIGEGVILGDRCRLGASVVVGEGCWIGADSMIYPQVTLYPHCQIGAKTTLHAGAVIGSDGFGYAKAGVEWVKIAQLGRVVIGDGVEVGANTTIDRGALDDTVIGNGVKIDNLVQIAHNVTIGDHTALAGCVGIAGSAHIGQHCAIGGGAGILGHLQIADGVTITATSLVTKSVLEPGTYSSGTPLQPNRDWQKSFARFKQLDEMARRIHQLELQLQLLATEGTSR